MRDLIKKILREESEVTEMGLSMSKLKAAQPKNYLVRSLKDREKTADLKKQMKEATQKCNTLYSEITQELKKIKCEDIILSKLPVETKWCIPSSLSPTLITEIFGLSLNINTTFLK
jgi:hypothetical protein